MTALQFERGQATMYPPDEARDGETPAIPRGERRRLATRARLLVAARVVFARAGLANATIAQIAQEADLGFGTFYLHFAAKEDAYRAVLTEGFAELRDRLAATRRRAQAEGLPWWERVRALVEAYYRFAVERRELFVVMRAGGETGRGVGRELVEQFTAQVAREIIIPWEDEQAASGVAVYPYPPTPTALAIVAALDQVVIWWMGQDDSATETPAGGERGQDADDQLTLDHLIETMSRFVSTGLGGWLPDEPNGKRGLTPPETRAQPQVDERP